jgi:hypothetical protein
MQITHTKLLRIPVNSFGDEIVDVSRTDKRKNDFFIALSFYELPRGNWKWGSMSLVGDIICLEERFLSDPQSF